jgi:transposase
MSKRQYKEGIDRQQAFLLPPIVDDYVSEDNPVRAIDAYVESLNVEKLGFTNTAGELTPGQPAFPPKVQVKLYLYGYLHGIRSSRKLARECQRNLEVIWLVQGLRPGYKTIANFRKDNLQALKVLNRDFVQLCKELNLYGGELVGIDGSFFRGNVGKKKIYTQEHLEKILKRIDKNIAEYLQDLDQADRAEEGEFAEDPSLQEKLTKLKERQGQFQARLEKLQASGEKQLAEVDEDARLLHKTGLGTIAGYNAQVAVDDKHKLIITGEVTQDGNDEQQLFPMAQMAKAELGVEELTTVQDKGYFNAQHLKDCQENGITPYLPEPDKDAHARRQGRFTRQDFSYDAQMNCFMCPAGQALKYSSSQERKGKRLWIYRSSVPVCTRCPLKGQCLPEKTARRTVCRWEHEEVLENHRKRMENDGPEMMRKRAELCEHPFGTLKMWMGWRHFLLRGLEKVRAEFSLLILAYNFRRVLSIMGLARFRLACQMRAREAT